MNCSSCDALRISLIEEQRKLEVLERDLVKAHADVRRQEIAVKELQAKNTLNAKNSNNTSCAFALPSEFKAAWDELVKELIVDAFADQLDNYERLVPLAQELFIQTQLKGKHET